MGFLKKYLLFLLLLANITSEYLLLAPISKFLFYSVLVISVPFLLMPEVRSPINRKRFPELIAMIIIYLIAQFVFQIDLWTSDNILYTIAKCSVFIIMMLCITSNFDFYFSKILDIFPYLILILLVFGWMINRYDSMGNVCFGFLNRNVACTLTTAGIAGFVFRKDKLHLCDIIILAFMFATILYGGSRNALAMCILIILIRYGISFKLLFVGIIALGFIFFVMPLLGIEITAFERLLGTFNGTVELDREEVQKAALQMIAERPWTGWGYSYANVSDVGIDMNAHNGYITTMENLGIPCGLSILSFIIIGSIKRLKLYFLKNRYINYHLSIIVSTLFGAGQEDYLVGVNQCTTNIFFMSFAVLGMYMHTQKLVRREFAPIQNQVS